MSAVLAISTFRSDESVLALIERAFEWSCFDRILVVDSLGTGGLAAEIEARGWAPRVCYEDHDVNLGSAGNLARRLEWGAEQGHEWVFALNHDGEVEEAVVDELLRVGRTLDRPGAVYPLRFKTGRSMFDLTGTHRLPMPFMGSSERPVGSTLEAYWGSSNGTLYATAPVRAGLKPWGDLFMGWEDLGYGWLLHKNGYRQVIVCAAVARDPYEYQTHRVGGRSVTITDKPTWYAYYQVRNLLLVTSRTEQSPAHWAAVGGRVALELVLTATLRPDKSRRARFIAAGLLDGLRSRSGKWALP